MCHYDVANSNEAQVGQEKEKGETVNNTSNNIDINWNPITIIRKYRQTGDPFRHLVLPMDFYAKVVAKYGLCPANSLSENNLATTEKSI